MGRYDRAFTMVGMPQGGLHKFTYGGERGGGRDFVKMARVRNRPAEAQGRKLCNREMNLHVILESNYVRSVSFSEQC